MTSKSSSTSKAAARAAKAAELRREQSRAEKRRRLLMIGAVAALFVLIVGGAVVVTVLNKDDVDAPSAGSDFGLSIGDKDAPHQVVIYEDFLCPLCGQVEAASHKGLAEAAAAGKVYVEYRPIAILTQFGDYTTRAANAFKVVLDESGGDVAKKFHDLLFAEQPAEDDEDSHFTDDELVDLAVQAGADEDAVRPGIEDLSQEQWVKDATAAASDAGVKGTPTILLDGKSFEEGSSWSDLGKQLVEAVQ